MRCRDGIVFGALALGGILLSGCLSSQPHSNAIAPPPPPRQDMRSGMPSAYHPMPEFPLQPSLDVKDKRVSQALHSSAPAQPEPPSSPAPVQPTIVIEPMQPPETPPVPAKKPGDEPLVEAMRCFLENRPADALPLLERYDKANQEAILRLLPLAARLTQGSIDTASPRDADAVLEQIQGLALPFRRKASLRIDKVCFCREIKRFGVYEPLPEERPEFRAGCSGQDGELFQVYAEIKNFATVAEKGLFGTEIASTAEIHNYQQEKVWQHDFPAKLELSRAPRQDYFINFRFCVPPNLPPGDYTLWIKVKDLKSQPPRIARRSLDFHVIANGSSRAPRGEMGGGPGHASVGEREKGTR